MKHTLLKLFTTKYYFLKKVIKAKESLSREFAEYVDEKEEIIFKLDQHLLEKEDQLKKALKEKQEALFDREETISKYEEILIEKQQAFNSQLKEKEDVCELMALDKSNLNESFQEILAEKEESLKTSVIEKETVTNKLTCEMAAQSEKINILVKELDQVKKCLEVQIAEKESLNQKLRLEVDELKVKYLAEIKSKDEALKEAVFTIEKNKATYESNLKSKEARIESMMSKGEKLTSNLSKIAEENTVLEQECEKYQKLMTKKDETVENTLEELRGLNEEVEIVLAEKERQEITILEDKAVMEKLEKQLAEKEELLQSIMTEKEKMTEEFTENLKEKQQKIAALSDETESLKVELYKISQELKLAVQEASNKSEFVDEKLKNTVKSLENNLKKMENEKFTINKQVEKLLINCNLADEIQNVDEIARKFFVLIGQILNMPESDSSENELTSCCASQTSSDESVIESSNINSESEVICKKIINKSELCKLTSGESQISSEDFHLDSETESSKIDCESQLEPAIENTKIESELCSFKSFALQSRSIVQILRGVIKQKEEILKESREALKEKDEAVSSTLDEIKNRMEKVLEEKERQKSMIIEDKKRLLDYECELRKKDDLIEKLELSENSKEVELDSILGEKKELMAQLIKSMKDLESFKIGREASSQIYTESVTNTETTALVTSEGEFSENPQLDALKLALTKWQDCDALDLFHSLSNYFQNQFSELCQNESRKFENFKDFAAFLMDFSESFSLHELCKNFKKKTNLQVSSREDTSSTRDSQNEKTNSNDIHDISECFSFLDCHSSTTDGNFSQSESAKSRQKEKMARLSAQTVICEVIDIDQCSIAEGEFREGEVPLPSYGGNSPKQIVEEDFVRRSSACVQRCSSMLEPDCDVIRELKIPKKLSSICSASDCSSRDSFKMALTGFETAPTNGGEKSPEIPRASGVTTQSFETAASGLNGSSHLNESLKEVCSPETSGMVTACNVERTFVGEQMNLEGLKYGIEGEISAIMLEINRLHQSVSEEIVSKADETFVKAAMELQNFELLLQAFVTKKSQDYCDFNQEEADMKRKFSEVKRMLVQNIDNKNYARQRLNEIVRDLKVRSNEVLGKICTFYKNYANSLKSDLNQSQFERERFEDLVKDDAATIKNLNRRVEKLNENQQNSECVIRLF